MVLFCLSSAVFFQVFCLAGIFVSLFFRSFFPEQTDGGDGRAKQKQDEKCNE